MPASELVIAILLLPWGASGMAQSNCDAMKVAQEFISMRYPSFQSAGLKSLVSEDGELWQLTYQLPEGSLGGVPVVVVDKRPAA